MQKLESFLILVNNLSDVYILTVVTMFSVAAVTLYCTRVMNRNVKVTKGTNSESKKSKKKAKNSDTEEEDDDNPELTNENSHLDSNSDSDELGRDYVREMKTAKLKQLEETLTEDQIKEERRIESQQLAAIYDLLKKQEEEYNTSSIDEIEFKRQLSLYR